MRVVLAATRILQCLDIRPQVEDAASYGAPGMAGYGNPIASGPHHYIGERHTGGRRSLFDDKIALVDHMRYSDGKTEEWLKTTANYLISRRTR